MPTWTGPSSKAIRIRCSRAWPSAALTVGARRAIVYVRAEYPLAVRTVSRAIEQAMELGLLGPDILGSGISLEISVFQGSGAFVCGEETALIAIHRRPPGHAPPSPALPGETGTMGTSNRDQQRQDPCLRAPHPCPRGRVVPGHRDPRTAREPPSSRWSATWSTPDWWRFPWACPSGPSSSTSAAASLTGRTSRPFRSGALREAVCRCALSGHPH